MKTISESDIRDCLTYQDVIEVLREAFRQETTTPLRHQHIMKKDNGEEDVLLLMPSWTGTDFGGVKLVNVVPANSASNLPAVAASYLLFSMKTGEHLAFLDGAEVTAARTACASALAADYLASKEASKLLIVGAGEIASRLAYAYRAVRPIREIKVWSKRATSAASFVARLNADGIEASVATELQGATEFADIISCATLATEPLIKGRWLQPGQHLDLIGSFTPDMRETDDDAIKCGSVFIDTPAALEETGDILGPILSGAMSKEDIKSDLFGLCRQTHPGRSRNDEITIFKAVGSALEDLAYAAAIYRSTTDAE